METDLRKLVLAVVIAVFQLAVGVGLMTTETADILAAKALPYIGAVVALLALVQALAPSIVPLLKRAAKPGGGAGLFILYAFTAGALLCLQGCGATIECKDGVCNVSGLPVGKAKPTPTPAPTPATTSRTAGGLEK